METSAHLFFSCQFASSIWTWLSAFLSCPSPINSIRNYIYMLENSLSPQANAVVRALIVYTIYLIWQARNSWKFKGKLTNWKSCVSSLMAIDKLVRCCTKRKANDSMLNFCFLKSFDININPRVPLHMFDVIWSLPVFGWIKCNMDGMEVRSLTACGGIFKDFQANQSVSFFAYLGEGSPVTTKFLAVIVAIEKAIQMKCSKI